MVVTHWSEFYRYTKLQSVSITPGILNFFMGFSLTLQMFSMSLQFSNLNTGCIYINTEQMRVHPSSSQLKRLCRESWHRRVCPWGRHISGVFLSNGNLTELVTSRLFPYAEVRFLSSLTEVTACVTECNKIKKRHKRLV